MELMPVGDRYLWYCDWCDTTNVTPWVRMGEKEVSCAACHKTFPSCDPLRSVNATENGRQSQLL